MKINITKLLAGESNKITIDRTIPITGSETDGVILSSDNEPIDTNIDGVVFTSPVHVTGEIVNKGGYIRLIAHASIKYEAECARCLKHLTREFSIDFERTVVGQGSLANTDIDDTDDYIEIVDGGIDIDNVTVEQIMMEFPSRELCSDDCKGLCPKCGKDLNEGECNCPKKEIDPRLAILQKLLEKS
jgi:uncharacterized protein